MTALSLAFADQVVVNTALEPSPARRDGCDFSDDGRIVDGLAADRSALTCPLFYVAIPACAVLMVATAVIEFVRKVSQRSVRNS